MTMKYSRGKNADGIGRKEHTHPTERAVQKTIRAHRSISAPCFALSRTGEWISFGGMADTSPPPETGVTDGCGTVQGPIGLSALSHADKVCRGGFSSVTFKRGNKCRIQTE